VLYPLGQQRERRSRAVVVAVCELRLRANVFELQAQRPPKLAVLVAAGQSLFAFFPDGLDRAAPGQPLDLTSKRSAKSDSTLISSTISIGERPTLLRS
jgi:hypothetical protein